MRELALALALVMVIEGALYGLFPAGMKRLMVAVLNQSENALRWTGLVLAIAGFTLAWVLRSS